MDDIQLNNILESYNQKMEQVQGLNMQCFETLQKNKTQAKLKSLINFKLFAVGLGVLWLSFLSYLFYFSLEKASIFFIISCGAVILLSLIHI